MLPAPFTHALVLTGPTASGKTRLGVELAQTLGAEIVSMDSMAIYRRMDIGTAKPTAAERRAVPHHLIDVLEPWDSASVAWWLDQAERCSRDIESRGKKVLIVGGTPLYLKALMFGLFDGPGADAELRQRLTEEARRTGAAGLHRRLSEVDPAAATRIHVNDLRRIIRALEVFQLTGRPISSFQREWRSGAKSETFSQDESQVLVLDVPRETLHERIHCRVEAMFAAGFVDEVRMLRGLGRALGKEASQAVGYQEILAHLDGLADIKETVERIQARTRQFAKQQMTWFRHLPGCRLATSELTWKLWQPKMSLERRGEWGAVTRLGSDECQVK